MPANAVTIIHKFIRREMFDLAERLFRAGADDVDSLRAAVEDLAAILRGHAEYEDANFALRLHKLDPEYATRMAEEHRRLEAGLETLCDDARALDPRAADCSEALLRFHLDWNRYLSAYLAHLDDEERTLFPLLKDGIPPVGAIARSVLARDSAQGEGFLLKLWSVTTCAERIAIEEALDAASAPTGVATE